ncbi:MAG TPA: MarR family transcriptional regulator [Candidatus Avichristensenella intestinipullorum]|uniref:MarR family transcriptional regulator n=1 Tax=Candidatus Avichristensenella intestinipullorum TaxID=2840693 RepID=A0A9D1CJH4_9FIRM|nr:MarR family transcriptional regulator [Candidatus Avichristensenella intestinipullorum]
MSRRKSLDPAVIESIAQNIFNVMPLLRKRLLHMDVIQSEHGIPLSHVQVLSMLNETGSMSVSEISHRLGIAKPNITPLVDRLIEEKLVDRIRDTQDRRVVNVVILEAGREKLAAIRATIGEQVQEWAQNISAADFRELADALSSLTRILSNVQKG